MKVIYIFLAMLLILTGCKDDGNVKIDSLSHWGETCFQGQIVPVWVSVDTDDKSITEYEWSCNGGEFQEIPGGLNNKLYQAVWIAPMENGTYTLTCKVTCGRSSETRSTEIVVDKYLYFDFENTKQNKYLRKTNVNASINSAKELSVKGSKKNEYGYVSTFIDTNPISPNLTFEVDLKTGKTYGVKEGATYFDFKFARPVMAENIQDDTYVRNLRVEVYPILPFESNNNNLKTSVIYDGTIEKKHNVFVWYEVYEPKFEISTWKLLTSYSDTNATLNKNTKTHFTANLDATSNNLILKFAESSNQISLNNILGENIEAIGVNDLCLGVYSNNCEMIIDNWSVNLND